MAIYLVTGGAGFIGSHLARALVARGETVRVIDNYSTGKRENLDDLRTQIEIIEASLNDLPALERAMHGVDYVLHQAAIPSVPRSIQDPRETHNATATGTLNVLLAAQEAHVKRVVYAGSSSAYGDIDGDLKREDMLPLPLSPYAAAKLSGEHYCQAFYHVYNLPTVILRYFNVFGPHQDPNSPYSAVIPRFITRMIMGQQPTIYGDGSQSRDFTYIDNVIQGNLLACQSEKASGQVINLACGDSITLLDLVASLNRLLGTSIEPQFMPPRVGDILHSRADITKARQLLGYEPLITFEQGLQRTLTAFSAQAPV